MTTTKTCRACKASAMNIIETSQSLTVKGVDLVVDGLLHWECPECHAELETPDQIDHNAELVRAAYVRERSLFKEAHGLLTGAKIRELRLHFGLTQKESSLVFGGGPTAFAKYEAEDIVQNTSMDKLIRVASEVPEAFAWLAKEAKIEQHMRHFSAAQFELIFKGFEAVANNKIRKSISQYFSEENGTKLGLFKLSGETFTCVAPCNDEGYANVA